MVLHSVCYISLVISDYIVFGFNKDIRIRIYTMVFDIDNYNCISFYPMFILYYITSVTVLQVLYNWSYRPAIK